jgi:glycosyltransferase involved in cell wall biosynthesis
MRITFVVPSDSVNRVHAVFDASFGDRLSVMPWMPRAQLRYVYSEHDILLFPSLFEGFGKVCLEAMSQAMCVVAFDEGGISDIAIANRDALYCKAGDYVRFRQLLRGAIENPEFAQEIGLAARSRVTTFTWDRTARRTRDFCEKLRGRYETKTARFARPNSSEALRAAANSAAKLQPH